jgi:hypothetical protein
MVYSLYDSYIGAPKSRKVHRKGAKNSMVEVHKVLGPGVWARIIRVGSTIEAPPPTPENQA